MKESLIGIAVCGIEKDYNWEPLNLSKKIDPLSRLLIETQHFLKPIALKDFNRKFSLNPSEFYIESSYGNNRMACLYLHLLPLQNPIIIIPTLDKPDLQAEYELEIYSSKEIKLEKLDNGKNLMLIGEWNEYNSGGCHIYNETIYKQAEQQTWQNNTIYLVEFEGEGPFRLRVNLNIYQKDWKSQLFKKKSEVLKNVSVDCMISVYVLKVTGKKPHLDDIITYTPYVPAFDTCLEVGIQDTQVLLMPATYESKIDGRYILTLQSDTKIKVELYS